MQITHYVTPAEPGIFVIPRSLLEMRCIDKKKCWQPEAWARMKAVRVVAWLHVVDVTLGPAAVDVYPLGVSGLVGGDVDDGGPVYFMPDGSVEWAEQSFPDYKSACY